MPSPTRIIAGARRGAHLATPEGLHTRPTLGRVREALFNIIAPRVTGARVADLFAGAGTLGLEALSRGAASCVFVENDAAALRALRANVARLRYEAAAAVRAETAEDFLASYRGTEAAQGFDLILLDPPYGAGMVEAVLMHERWKELAAPNALIVVQTEAGLALPEHLGCFRTTRAETYGRTTLHFLVADSG